MKLSHNEALLALAVFLSLATLLRFALWYWLPTVWFYLT